MFSTDQYKKARQVWFSFVVFVFSTKTRVVSHPGVPRLKYQNRTLELENNHPKGQKGLLG